MLGIWVVEDGTCQNFYKMTIVMNERFNTVDKTVFTSVTIVNHLFHMQML